MATLLLYNKIRGSTFFWEAIFATPRNCPGRNNSHFGLENEGWKMSLVFLVRHPPWFFSFSDMVWRLPIYGMYQELYQASKATHLSLEKKPFAIGWYRHMLPQKLSPNFRGHSFGFRGTPCSTNSFATLSRGKEGSISWRVLFYIGVPLWAAARVHFWFLAGVLVSQMQMMPKHGGYILAATHFSMDIASFIILRFAFYTYVLPGLWTPQLLRTFPKACVSNPQFDITHLYTSSLVHFSGRRSLQHPDCPGRNNSHFGLENEGWKMSLVFLVWHPHWFFSFSDMVWRLSLLGMYQELCGASKATHLMSIQPKCKKLEKGWRRQCHLVWCRVFLQCSDIESDCFEIFQSQLGNPRISPFEFLLGTACWSKKQDAGMLAGNAKRIFCDNVTCFGTNESCWNRSHLPEFFIKAPHFLLAWLLCFFTIKSEVLRFSGRRSSQHPGIVLAGTIHTLAWKMRVEKCPLSFWYGILPGSFRFQTWCGDFHFWECIKNSVEQAKQLTWCQYSQNARSSRKVEEDKVTSCGVGLLAMFRHRKWLLWDLPISARKSTNIALWVLIRHCLLIEETRRWNAGWQR